MYIKLTLIECNMLFISAEPHSTTKPIKQYFEDKIKIILAEKQEDISIPAREFRTVMRMFKVAGYELPYFKEHEKQALKLLD